MKAGEKAREELEKKKKRIEILKQRTENELQKSKLRVEGSAKKELSEIE